MKTTVIILALSMALFTSCREKIDLELDNASSRIVIEGVFTNENKEHEVRVTRSIGYLDGNSTPAVTNAVVTLTDGTNSYVLTHTGNGVYKIIPAISGVSGRRYTLSVVVDGVEYTASETMSPITPLDSLSIQQANYPLQPGVVWKPGVDYYNVGVFCQEPGNETNFYLFDLYKNSELFTDTVTKKFFSDDGFINGSYIYGMNVMQIDAMPGDTLRLVMSSMSKEYYSFLYGIISAGMSGNPFAGQPSNVDNNISGGALGYFRVSSVTELSGIVE